MKLLRNAINPFLAGTVLTAVLALAVGCASSEEREKQKEASSLRLFLEQEFDPGDKTTLVPIYRADPMLVRIEKVPFLDEGHLTNAQVVDVVGGFAIVVNFDFHGTLVLENVSNSYRGRRIAIYSMFTDGRWLAAPVINGRIEDGSLGFTPDCTREEAERIVSGLNNVAVKLGNRPKPGKEPKEDDF
jgi:preprotein translocase subunit SecD